MFVNFRLLRSAVALEDQKLVRPSLTPSNPTLSHLLSDPSQLVFDQLRHGTVGVTMLACDAVRVDQPVLDDEVVLVMRMRSFRPTMRVDIIEIIEHIFSL